MANQQGQSFEDLRNTLGECWRILRHRWRSAVIAFTLVGTAGFWYSQYLPREYQAATLFERRDDAVLQNLIKNNSPYGFDHLRTTLNMDIAGSRALARAAVTSDLLPPDTFPGTGVLSDEERAALDGILSRYELGAEVRLVNSSPSLDTIALECTANDPRVAREFVVALRDNYIAETRERIREILSGTRDFFAAEITRLQDEIGRAEQTMRTGFDEFLGLDPTDMVAVGSRLETLRMQRDTAYQRKAELEAQISAREQFLQALLRSGAAAGPMTPDARPTAPPRLDPALETSIVTVRNQLTEMVTARRMTWEHPDVKRLRSRLDALEDLRESLLAAAADPSQTTQPALAAAPETAHVQQLEQMRVELELTTLHRQLDTANSQWNELEGRVSRLSELYDRLVSEGDGLRQLRDKQVDGAAELAVWQTHQAQLERILTAEAGERGTQFALLEEPAESSRPVKPRVATIFLVCLGLGTAAAALLLALAELLDRSFRSVGQVTRVLGVPVLECVSVIPTPREKRRALVGRLVWGPAVAMLVLAWFASASLAYVSLARPDLHRRTLQKVDRVLDTVGLAVLTTPDRSR